MRAEAADPRADDARGARAVRAEGEHSGLRTPVAVDQRVLHGDVRVRAPDIDAVGAHANQAEPAEPHVAGAVEDRDRDPAARSGAAAVDREVRDRDAAPSCDEHGEVGRAGRGREHCPRPRPEEAGAVADPHVVEAVPAGGEADSDVTAAQRDERPLETAVGRSDKSLRAEGIGGERDRLGRSAPAMVVDRGDGQPVPSRRD